ncbi:uncharacterized protein LOC125236648 isoform X2 [Leguminivora glycinivorella]|uniref:uncharacterized protein LOC125236648 isoform X2 n=1 Tax=Leguminivora glycinivorella TaxID=1035111 RepID=UPI00200E8716|nr:uncharacterized protein LOC125236648 isoform X2 [Leguminivora glycinivorella]
MEDEAATGSNAGLSKLLSDSDERPRSAVNSVVLDYYKKFGRKRDLEQYFSLTTAQADIRDPRSLFWRRMKEQSDTSDSGEKKSESSNEICRISIKCSIPERSEMERQISQSNEESESPPIITDVLPAPSPSGDESIDDNHSQKSADVTLDTSTNKPLSPTSSITSQRKLEWDSLADVGYGNESDKKTSASSLSTLEREVLAQKQHFTLDFKQNSDLGIPTAHSTPVDPNDSNPKTKKGQGKKTISISRKDVDLVEVNVPHNMENVQPINVNLTKQFSLNLQKDGAMTIDNVKKDTSISPEKKVETEKNAGVKLDKEIQTSLLRSNEKDKGSNDHLASTSAPKIPILIGLNTLRRNQRRKKIRKSRTKLKGKQRHIRKKQVIVDKDKSGEQVSEAESFEYMPGHMYHQNQLRKQDSNRSNNNNNNVGNKSSLESSAVHTTDSSKESKYSLSKDLDKTLNVLKSTLKDRYDSNLKKKLVTEIIHRLLKSNYGEGETTPEFLSVLSLTNKKTPTTGTSEADNTEQKVVHTKPKKSILRSSKFDPRNVASTSQSAPNLPSVVESDKPVTSYLSKIQSSTTTETDLSNNSAKDGTSSDTVFAKTSSQELYKKYISALKKEEAYKQHLRDKELFLKQKLVRTEPAKKVPAHLDINKNSYLKDLINDLTRNNYDDGSGDASILEGGSSNLHIVRQGVPIKHRSHSVFTLSSGNSDLQDRTSNAKIRMQKNSSPRGEPNWERNVVGACNKPAVTDSSVQVNINVHDKPMSPKLVKEEKYVCLCTAKTRTCHHSPDEVEVYKCPISRPVTISKPCVSNQQLCGVHSASSSLKNDTSKSSSKPKTDKTVVECTRCVQTKMSIHPKISDPSVSDLNIIDSADCVKLINELYRKVSKTNTECRCSNEKQDCNSYTCKSSKDNMRRNDGSEQDNLVEDLNQMAPLVDQKPVEENLIQSCIGCNKNITKQPDNAAENIVIPIQGTNMMLKLSIGGNTLKIQNEEMPKSVVDSSSNVDTLDREMFTVKQKPSLKGMSNLPECPVPVQAETSNAVYQPKCNLKTNQDKMFSVQDPLRNDYKTKHEGEIQRKNNYGILTDSGAAGRSTYPKKVQIHEKKPLLRSNTDTGNLGACSGMQTETIFTKDEEIHAYFKTPSDQDFSIKSTQSKTTDDNGSRSQSIKSTPCQSQSESSKSSTEAKFHSFNTSKNKYSAEWRKLKDQQGYDALTDEGKPKDLILEAIKDITNRYTKRDTDKHSKKKCFKEIMNALSYLLDTDDSGDGDQEFSQSSKDFHKNVERTKEKNDNIPDFTAQKSNTYERNMKVESFNRESKQSRRFSEASGIADLENLKTKQAPVKFTCNKGCGCDGTSECIDCSGPLKTSAADGSRKSPRSGKSSKIVNDASRKNVPCSTEVEPIKSVQEAYRFEDAKGKSEVKESCAYDSSKFIKGIGKAPNHVKTCDVGCGCDSSSECKDCEKSDSPTHGESTRCDREFARSKNAESRGNTPREMKKTCDKGCGCDGSSECKDCMESHSPKYKNICDESEKPKNKQVRCGSPKKTKKTCDKSSCGDNSSECNDTYHSPKSGSGECGKESRRPRNVDRCTSPRKTETCDRGCGCDASSECSKCVEIQSPKRAVAKCRKVSVKPKKQERCTSPKKIETSEKGCGCYGSDCDECIESMPLKCRTDGKESKLKKQSRCTSPKKIETSEKGCGCNGSDCDECIESLPLKCRTDAKESKLKQSKCTSPRKPEAIETRCMYSSLSEREYLSRPRQSRCNSPKKLRATCDRSCGCDGTSECKDCSHKTGKCDKERNKRQDAKKFVNKCVQSTVRRVKSLYSHHCDDSSDIPVSTDPPCCSTDSPTTKLVHKIKKECEKYQKRCKACKKCEASSTTTVSCDHCRREKPHHRHRCRHRSKSTEKIKKKCVAYNLIVQTSDSLISEEAVFERYRPLQNVIVRVPKYKNANVPFKEACAKIEQKLPYCDTRFEPKGRSQSWPNECGISSTDDVKIANACTVRDYLEQNRPDFVNSCETRQNCIRMTSESRAKERSKLREQLVGLESLPTLNDEEIIYLAKQLGFRRRRPLQQNIMSEREMKKHSEKIYKSLPEVVQKKEEAKKENIKKTNLLMANIFKKNLQKKVLSGDVNISNYSQVVKI